MFEKIFHPISLCVFNFIAGSLPYLLWSFGYPHPSGYSFTITGVPIVLQALATIFLVVGISFSGALFKNSISKRFVDERCLDSNRLVVFSHAAIAITFVQFVMAVRLYGGIPIVSFLFSKNITDVNQLQNNSGFGQLGALSVSIAVLSGLFMLLSICTWDRRREKSVTLLILFVTIFICTVFQGKRQGFFLFLFSLMTFSCCVVGNPFNLYLNAFRMRSLSDKSSIFLLMVLCFVGSIYFYYIGYIRNGDIGLIDVFSGVYELIHYLALPLMNFETQISHSGFSAGESSLVGPMLGLVPYKTLEVMNLLVDPPPKVELSIGSGMVGSVHWFWGIPGVVCYSLFIGVLVGWAFTNSKNSAFACLSYAQMAWAIFAAHSYNHFLALVFIPIPIFCFSLIVYIVTRNRIK